jgi:putative phage-type endonuclease
MLTAQQIEARRNGIGGSDIPAVANLYPTTWKNRRGPEDVLAEKLGEVAPFEGNARTRRGDRMEPVIARFWSEDSGIAVTKNDETISHPVQPVFFATPDYLAADGSLVEVKYVGLFVGKSWVQGPPDYVLAQVQWTLGVTGRARAYVAAFIEGGDEVVRSFPVEFEPETFERLTFLATRFWQRVMEARAAKERFASHG